MTAVCPCGSPDYETCCATLHRGVAVAETPEQLMRSRYSAFARADIDYVQKTQTEKLIPEELKKTADWAKSVDWVSVTVLGTTGGAAADENGTVHFEARYFEKGKLYCLSENSHFSRIDDRWVYLNGKGDVSVTKPDRQAACPCGSGKTFKKCHEKW